MEHSEPPGSRHDGRQGREVRLDRRSLLRAGVASTAAAMVASRAAGAGALDRRAVLTAARPRVGGNLRVGIEAETNGLNPLASQIAGPGMYYARAIFDPIAVVTSTGAIQPYLCRSITPNIDATQWTFVLRPGITFHDGTPLDSSALANHFAHIQHSPLSAVSAFSLLTAIDQPDGLTVRLHLSAPWVALPSYLVGSVGVAQLGLVAAPAMLANQNGANQPVGSGPFIFVSWEPGSHLVVRRNPHYWQKGLPYLNGITFTPIVDDTARLQSLQSGGLDLIATASPLSIGELRNDNSFNVLTNLAPSPIEPGQNFILLNCAQPPLDDVRVRRALAFATDQKKVIALSGGGLGTPSTGLFSPGSRYYAKTNYPSFNLRRAQALVAQYRADKGSAPSFPLSVQGTTFADEAQQLQQMWRTAGIVVSSIDQVDSNTGISNALDGTYHAAVWSQYEAADPDQNYSFWATKTIAPPGQGGINFARFGNAVVDHALDTGRTNIDPATRIRAYRTISDQFALNCPYIWINRSVQAVASAQGVHGYSSVSLPGGGYALALNEGNIWLQQIWLT